MRKRRPFSVIYPRSPAALAVGGIGKALVEGKAAKRPKRTGFFRRLMRGLVGTPAAATT